jgi:hypothetical protein
MCVSACFAVTGDIGNLHGPASSSGDDDSGPPGAPEDLTITFEQIYQHVGQPFDLKVIDGDNFVQTHVVIAPLRMTDGRFKISVPRAISRGKRGYRLDFWADENLNGSYDFDKSWEYPLKDHSWRISLDDGAPLVTHSSGAYAVAFVHVIDFVDINEYPEGKKNPPKDTKTDARVRVVNLGGPLQGKMVQVRVADPSGHVVGIFRSSTQTDFVIKGCIEPNNVYDVDLYVDANGNNDENGNGYDDPSKGAGADLGWRLVHQQALATGLDVTFDAADTATGNVDVGPP